MDRRLDRDPARIGGTEPREHGLEVVHHGKVAAGLKVGGDMYSRSRNSSYIHGEAAGQ